MRAHRNYSEVECDGSESDEVQNWISDGGRQRGIYPPRTESGARGTFNCFCPVAWLCLIFPTICRRLTARLIDDRWARLFIWTLDGTIISFPIQSVGTVAIMYSVRCAAFLMARFNPRQWFCCVESVEIHATLNSHEVRGISCVRTEQRKALSIFGGKKKLFN